MIVNSQRSLELFAALGQKLKAAREAKGLTLAEISASTRITQHYLNAIESGDPGPLPAPTFVRGFVRNYAVTVGLDEHEVLEDFRQFSETQEKVEIPLEPPAEVENPPLMTVPVTKLIFLALVVGLVIWVGLLIFRSSTTSEAPPPPAERPAASDAQSPSSEEVAPPMPSAPVPAAPTVAPPATPAARPGTSAPAPPPGAGAKPAAHRPGEPAKALQLRVRGLERTWIRLSVDRREPIDVLLEPAETAEWEANEEFRLTVGKSHGVSVYLNDEEIALPEEPNVLVQEIVLNKVTLFKLEN